MTDLSALTMLACPAIGQLGDKTRVTHFPICKVCDRSPLPEFAFIEYVFDHYSGEDLVTAMGRYALSARLRDALEAAGLKGMAFRDMAVAKNEQFDMMPTASAGELPTFYELLVMGKAAGPELWWTSSKCAACGITHWDRNSEGTKAELAVLTGDLPVPRQMYRDSWSGDDTFRLADPGPPLMTERWVAVTEKIGVMGLLLQPAQWVER